MSHKQTLANLLKVFAVTNLPDVPFNSKTDEDEFEDFRVEVQDAVKDEVSLHERALGPIFAREQAMIALFHEIHGKGGASAALRVLQELCEALEAYEAPRLRKVKG